MLIYLAERHARWGSAVAEAIDAPQRRALVSHRW
jgi:glucose-6-phosphate dehydrogenase assembly protein OpcA